MPIGVNVNNPQSQVSETPTSTATGPITFGGNVIGSGSSATTATGDGSFSNILLYGVIGLVVIWFLKKVGI